MSQTSVGAPAHAAQPLVKRSRPNIFARFFAWAFVALAVGCALVPGSAAAVITIVVPSVTVPYSASPQTGSFEVYVTSTETSPPQVGDFTVKLLLAPSSGAQFTAVATTTVHPYIFAPQTDTAGTAILNGGLTAEISDYNSQPTPPTLANNMGLMAVTYTVAAGTTGTFNLTLDTNTTEGDATVLDDQNGNPIPFSNQNNATLAVVIATPATAYWKGTVDGNWTTDNSSPGTTNWTLDAAGSFDTHALPGSTTDVFFTTNNGGANLTTTLGSSFAIKGLTFTSTATSAVSIGGANTLTIGADGLTVQSGAAAPEIGAGVALGATQTWTINGSNPMTVNGAFSTGGFTLNKAGPATLVLGGQQTFGAGTMIESTSTRGRSATMLPPPRLRSAPAR